MNIFSPGELVYHISNLALPEAEMGIVLGVSGDYVSVLWSDGIYASPDRNLMPIGGYCDEDLSC